MTLRLSTGMRNSRLGDAFLKGTSLAFATTTTVTDSENRFLDAGYKVGDTVTFAGSTTNNGTGIITIATAGTLTFGGSVFTIEAFLAATTMIGDNGNDLKALFTNGNMRIRTGAQPVTADLAEIGTLLAEITLASGAFTPGSPTNGLNFEGILNGVLAKAVGETWSGLGLVNGTAGWFRFYDNRQHTGAVKSAVRFDGSCGTSGSNLVLSTVSVVLDVPVSITQFNVTMPTL